MGRRSRTRPGTWSCWYRTGCTAGRSRTCHAPLSFSTFSSPLSAASGVKSKTVLSNSRAQPVSAASAPFYARRATVNSCVNFSTSPLFSLSFPPLFVWLRLVLVFTRAVVGRVAVQVAVRNVCRRATRYSNLSWSFKIVTPPFAADWPQQITTSSSLVLAHMLTFIIIIIYSSSFFSFFFVPLATVLLELCDKHFQPQMHRAVCCLVTLNISAQIYTN